MLAWVRALAAEAGAPDPDGLARSLTLLLDGGLASGALDADPEAARGRPGVGPDPGGSARTGLTEFEICQSMLHAGVMTTSSITRRLGATGPTVSALGLGLMGMSDLYGPADEAESIATIHAALDAGITLLDTGDFYGMGHNELLLREALRGRDRDRAVISVKFGALRGPDGSWSGVDTRPAAIKNFLAYTLRRLGTDHVDVYRPARLDPTVPIEETVGALAELVAGRLRPAHRPVRGGRRHPAPRARRAPGRRPADRVLPDLPRHRGRDPARPPASSASASRRTASSPAACCRGTGRPTATRVTSGRTCRASPGTT